MDNTRHISLCETLDRVLNKGAVVTGEITLSVANIDLIYLGLQIMVSSIETARGYYNSPVNRGIIGRADAGECGSNRAANEYRPG